MRGFLRVFLFILNYTVNAKICHYRHITKNEDNWRKDIPSRYFLCNKDTNGENGDVRVLLENSLHRYL